jgi:hypothetical protein
MWQSALYVKLTMWQMGTRGCCVTMTLASSLIIKLPKNILRTFIVNFCETWQSSPAVVKFVTHKADQQLRRQTHDKVAYMLRYQEIWQSGTLVVKRSSHLAMQMNNQAVEKCRSILTAKLREAYQGHRTAVKMTSDLSRSNYENINERTSPRLR